MPNPDAIRPLRRFGSIAGGGAMYIGPDVRSDERLLAAEVQRYVRRETEPIANAVEQWGERLDKRLVWADDARERDMALLKQRLLEQDALLAQITSSQSVTRIELNALHRDLLETARVLEQVRHDSLSARWRRFITYLAWWRR